MFPLGGGLRGGQLGGTLVNVAFQIAIIAIIAASRPRLAVSLVACRPRCRARASVTVAFWLR
jgi:hypothetical protein